MRAKYLYAEFIIIYLLSLIPWPDPNVIKLLCSKDSARLVRKLVHLKWTPILEKYKVKLPLECPLHPLRDVFGPQQEAKKRDRPSQWTCRLCGKSFFQEKFLDIHFDNRHQNNINKAEDAVCFGDFCDIMRCDVFISQENNFSNADYIVTDLEVWRDGAGYNTMLMQVHRAHIVSLISERKKESSFFWKDQSEEKEKGLLTQPRPFCKGSKSTELTGNIDDSQDENGSFEKANSHNKSPECDENASRTMSMEYDKQHSNFVNIQKEKANCKQEKLSKLKTKCELLIRACIMGLLLQMSDYAFKQMEDELNKAICWYLSCDRYWEDGPLEPRVFPWGLILILIVVLSLGICFCYYIIWILFDSEETIKNIPPGVPHSPIYVSRDAVSRKDGCIGLSAMDVVDGNQDPRNKRFVEEATSNDSNELNHSDHYIYVTYPPDLKRRLLEKYD